MDKNMKDPFNQSAEESGEACGILIDKPLVLIGLMGVGKTTVGRRLAKRLDLPFVDADEEIEKAADLKVTEIFDRFGEDYFRDGERRVIARLIEGPCRVIATGGGAFMNDETRELILANATAIWLDADIETLVKRVGRRDTRPLLRSGNTEEILRTLAAKRNPVYALAHVHVTGNDAPHDLTVDKVIEALRK
ncbi:MAG: shikimate kinase [Sphingorhabdus sp.]|jgi:shikimate kinase|nr:shikimate kinase [Sphingorhabdus sp.]